MATVNHIVEVVGYFALGIKPFLAYIDGCHYSPPNTARVALSSAMTLRWPYCFGSWFMLHPLQSFGLPDASHARGTKRGCALPAP